MPALFSSLLRPRMAALRDARCCAAKPRKKGNSALCSFRVFRVFRGDISVGIAALTGLRVGGAMPALFPTLLRPRRAALRHTEKEAQRITLTGVVIVV